MNRRHTADGTLPIVVKLILHEAQDQADSVTPSASH